MILVHLSLYRTKTMNYHPILDDSSHPLLEGINYHPVLDDLNYHLHHPKVDDNLRHPKVDD